MRRQVQVQGQELGVEGGGGIIVGGRPVLIRDILGQSKSCELSRLDSWQHCACLKWLGLLGANIK